MKEKHVKVTQHQREVLKLLSQHEQITIGTLASLLGVSSVAATKNIHRLEQKRLVKRVVDEQDHRRTLIFLTQAGQSIVDAWECEGLISTHTDIL
ncbi:MAG TPA: MarR family transcriptional regulator [Ktedonobacteraceae bacterium]|nr:MarR family transcriptional regulator [Ktedonobacteraceae bacterium]